jgi:hypothetical protein
MAIGGLALYLQNLPTLHSHALALVFARVFVPRMRRLWVGRDAYGGAARVGRLCIAYQLVTFPSGPRASLKRPYQSFFLPTDLLLDD